MPTDGRFLPQYAAQAVIDLECTAKRLRDMPDLRLYASAVSKVAGLIRHAVHVVLPDNAEVYRSNYGGGEIPTADECDSFEGLPAPITCFEYPWLHRGGLRVYEGQCVAPRRITIVSDGKQTYTGPVPDGYVHCATFLSVFYHEGHRTWALAETSLSAMTPLRVSVDPRTGFWGAQGVLRSLVTGERYGGPDDPDAIRVAGEFHVDVTAAIQCCHALRAGAHFEERTEPSGPRRWKFDKRGVGGFTYHVLRLPERRVSRDGPGTDTHASPRLHVRRAHIRKLPSGLLTFVRQCLVGDAARGVVEKSYEVQRIDARRR